MERVLSKLFYAVQLTLHAAVCTHVQWGGGDEGALSSGSDWYGDVKQNNYKMAMKTINIG